MQHQRARPALRARGERQPLGGLGARGERVERLPRNARACGSQLVGAQRVELLREQEAAPRRRALQLTRELAEARRADFDAALARVAGGVEMGVTVYLADAPAAQLPVEETAAAPASGREYLERRRAALHAEQARRVEAEALRERVASCFDAALPVMRTLLPAPGVAGTLAHLVPRDRLAEYRDAVERASRALPDVRLARSGPWAPYSFV
jgi:hypothetical protein